MLRQKADQTNQAEQADQIPDEVALVGTACETVFSFGRESAAIRVLGRCGAECRSHQEQRE